MSKIKKPDLTVVEQTFEKASAYLLMIRKEHRQLYSDPLVETQEDTDDFVFCYKNETDKLLARCTAPGVWNVELYGDALTEIFKNLKVEDFSKLLASFQPPPFKGHVPTWIYPIAAVVTRHLKLEGCDFPKVIHAFVPIDPSKYNIPDDGSRKNPMFLEQEMRRELETNIHEFKKKFPEFKKADFDIMFITPDEVIPGW